METNEQNVGERSSQREELTGHDHSGCLQREVALQERVAELTRQNEKQESYLRVLLSHSISVNVVYGERYKEYSDYNLAEGKIKEAEMTTHSLKIIWENNHYEHLEISRDFPASEICLFGGLQRILIADVVNIREDPDHSSSTFRFKYNIIAMDVRESYEGYDGFVGDEENILILRVQVNNWCRTEQEKGEIITGLESAEQQKDYFFKEIFEEYPNVDFEFIDAWIWSAGFSRMVEKMGANSELQQWQWTPRENQRGRRNGSSGRPGAFQIPDM